MGRLSIEITPEQHQKLKAIAALHGQSIKDYVLERIFPHPSEEQQALDELKQFLMPRIEAAERGELSEKTFAQIKLEALAKAES
jgi:uncharacterized protein (DUF1778 family)